MKKLKVPTVIKCDLKVKERRQQITDAAKELFLEKGFHKTTTREISKKANLSFGAIYEYISNKEDILYLIIEQFYDELEVFLIDRVFDDCTGLLKLNKFIKNYYTVVDQLSIEVNLIYRDIKALPYTYMEYVQAKEIEFLNSVKKIIIDAHKDEKLVISEGFVTMLARNLIIQGHMWAFRNWDLVKKTTLEEYINFQIIFFTNAIREHSNTVKI